MSIEILLPKLSEFVLRISCFICLLIKIATPADWLVGPEFQRETPSHSFVHSDAVTLVGCVSCIRVISDFYDLSQLNVLFLFCMSFSPLTFIVVIVMSVVLVSSIFSIFSL